MASDLELLELHGYLDKVGLKYFKQQNDTLTDTKIAVETNRAKSAESSLNTAINNEVSRAKKAEETLTSNLSAEINRAKGAENTLTTNLNAEITRAKSAEQANITAINNEITRSKNAESNLDSKKIDKTVVATSSALGLIKSGTDITVDSNGNVSVNDDSHNHIISNVDGLQTALDAKVPITRTINGKSLSNNITLTPADIGADTNGSSSTALANAKTYTDTKIANLVGSAPDTLNTLEELADALKDNADIVDVLNASIATKVDKVSGKGLSANDFTTAEKNKLASIASGANAYTHPAYTAKTSGLYKITVDATGHVSGVTAVAKSDITSLGIPGSDTVYSLPAAGSALGGVKTGGDVTISSGVITVNDDSHNHVISNIDGLQSALDGKSSTSHAHSAVTTSANGFMTSADKTKLNKIPYAHYYTESNNSGYYKIKINSTTSWMMSFTIRVYQAYKATDIMISGYNYGNNYWYSPSAVILGDSKKESISVVFGHDSAYNLWVAIPASQYTGLDIFNVTNGYSQISSFENLFTITNVSSVSGDKTVTAYAPYYRDDTVAKAATCTGNAATATNVAWSGITSKPSYYDAKAIKSITRSGTTFTYTCMDGTTGTFTQQDNNTTYSAATTSAAGLMSAADKSKLDAITASADSVSFSRSLSSGTKIGTITINGTATDLYCQTNTDTNTTYSQATSSALGLVKIGYSTSGKNYAVQLNSSGQMYVNVPWTDTNTNTTYSAGTGLSLSGTTFSLAASGVTAGTYGLSSNASPAHGGTFKVPYITVDKYGRITSLSSYTVTLPTDSNTTYTLSSFGITATATELNYCDGVTSNIQTQLNGKAASSHTHDYASSSHTHSYLPLSGGQMTGSITHSGSFSITPTNSMHFNFNNASSTAHLYINSTYANTSNGGIIFQDTSVSKSIGGLYVSTKGTASAEGVFRGQLGNPTASGTAGNYTGQLWLYAKTGKAAILQANTSQAGNYQVYLPSSGTIATSSSDIRLKENIKDTEETNALSLVNSIKFRQFDWKESGKHQKLGVIADELEDIDEHLVLEGTGGYDGEDEDGNPRINVKCVDAFYLMGYYGKAIQELSCTIDALRREIEELKSMAS